MPVSPDAAIGRLSRQDAMQSQQMALELQRRSQQRLAQIDAALKPIVEGTFGFCLRCEEEIGAARLKVTPEAYLCVRCARWSRRTETTISSLASPPGAATR